MELLLVLVSPPHPLLSPSPSPPSLILLHPAFLPLFGGVN